MHAVVADQVWREPLPPACPPLESQPLMPQVLLRLCGPEPICEMDFASHVALGRKPLPKEACKFSACSMYLASTSPETIRDLRRFPKLKHKTAVAKVMVDPSAGVAHIESHHVNIWLYASFDPVVAVKAVIPIDAFNG